MSGARLVLTAIRCTRTGAYLPWEDLVAVARVHGVELVQEVHFVGEW